MAGYQQSYSGFSGQQASRNGSVNDRYHSQKSKQGVRVSSGTSREAKHVEILPAAVSVTSKKLDEEFVTYMLEVENRYKVLPKHERIRIENWVSIEKFNANRARSFVR